MRTKEELKKIIVIIVVLIGCIVHAKAQSCADKLEEAEQLYQTGQFFDVIDLLDSCAIKSGEEQQFKVHRLLALAYLGLNKDAEAKNHIYELMELNPVYIPNKLNEPAEFVRMVETVNIIPRFSIGFGLNMGPSTTLPQAYSAHMITDQVKKYTGKNTVQFGLSGSYHINSTWAVNVSVAATSKSYDLDYSFGNWELQMQEKLNYLDFPMMMRYTPTFKSRIKPFAQAGIYTGVLLWGDNSFTARYLRDESQYELSNINSAERRNRIDLGLGAGLGATFKIKNGHISLIANFFQSIRNISNEDARYNFPDLQQSYFYLDDDMRLSNISIGFGLSQYFNYRVIRDK